MNSMKSIKIISIFLLISVIGSLFSISASAKKSNIKTYKQYKYIEVNDKKEIRIVGFETDRKKLDESGLTISFPKKIKGKKVTELNISKVFNSIFKNHYAIANSQAVPLSIKINSRIKNIIYTRRMTTQIYWYDVDANNKYYSSKKGVLYNKSKTKLINYNALYPRKTFSIPKTVKNIGSLAFVNSENLKKVNLNIGLKTIEYYALSGVDRINKIPKTVTTIKTGAFCNCWSLKKIKVPSSVKILEKCNFGYTTLPYPKYNKQFIIKGKKGSAAWKYAKKHKLKFKAV